MAGELQDYTVDQAAGAIALTLRADGMCICLVVVATERSGAYDALLQG